MYPPFSEPILATAVKLLKQFDALYVINKQRYYVTGISPAVGRYPEDLYDGVSGKTGGNPWVLTTAAFANLYYILVARWKETGVILLLPSIKELALEYFYCTDKFPDEMSVRSRLGMHLVKNMTRFADGFLKRIQRHTDKDGSLSEQIHRETGKKHGAYDLTWSHVEVIRAIEARN